MNPVLSIAQHAHIFPDFFLPIMTLNWVLHCGFSEKKLYVLLSAFSKTGLLLVPLFFQHQNFSCMYIILSGFFLFSKGIYTDPATFTPSPHGVNCQDGRLGAKATE